MSDNTRADVISDVAVSLDGFAAALGDTVGAKFLEERASVLKGIAFDMVQEHDPLAAVRALNEKKLQGDLEAALLESPDQPTEELQEIEPLVASDDKIVALGEKYDAEEVEANGVTYADSATIGSFSDVTDEAVRAAGGEPISAPIDAAIDALRDIPDFGPTES